MFRRIETGLPKDPCFPYDLEKLGYFITESGHFKSIEKPEEDFQFFITNNERCNEVHREAFHSCVRSEITKRLGELGVGLLHLPQLTEQKPLWEPHVPIFATSREQLRRCKRIFVVVNDPLQDLGVLAYRTLTRDGGLNEGSVLGLVKELQSRFKGHQSSSQSALGHSAQQHSGDRLFLKASSRRVSRHGHDDGDPGIIVLNPGQNLYSHKYNQTMTHETWMALPRKSALHPAPFIDGNENTVPGHKTISEHIKTVFDSVVNNEDFVSRDAKIYFIALQDAAEALFEVLDGMWNTCGRRIAAIVTTRGYKDQYHIDSPYLQTFLAHRGRSWVVSEHPLNATIAIPGKPPKADWLSKPVDSAHRKTRSEKLATYLKVLNRSGLGESAIETSPNSATGSGTRNSSSEDLRNRPPMMRLGSGGKSQPQTPGIDEFMTEYIMKKSETLPSPPPERRDDGYSALVDRLRVEGALSPPRVLSRQARLGSSESLNARAISSPLRASTSATTDPTGTSAMDFVGPSQGAIRAGDLAEVSLPDRGASSTVYKNIKTGKTYRRFEVSCPTFSGGEAWHAELVLPTALQKVLDWFQEVASNERTYRNPPPESWNLVLDEQSMFDDDNHDWTKRVGLDNNADDVDTAAAELDTTASSTFTPLSKSAHKKELQKQRAPKDAPSEPQDGDTWKSPSGETLVFLCGSWVGQSGLEAAGLDKMVDWVFKDKMSSQSLPRSPYSHNQDLVTSAATAHWRDRPQTLLEDDRQIFAHTKTRSDSNRPLVRVQQDLAVSQAMANAVLPRIEGYGSGVQMFVEHVTDDAPGSTPTARMRKRMEARREAMYMTDFGRAAPMDDLISDDEEDIVSADHRHGIAGGDDGNDDDDDDELADVLALLRHRVNKLRELRYQIIAKTEDEVAISETFIQESKGYLDAAEEVGVHEEDGPGRVLLEEGRKLLAEARQRLEEAREGFERAREAEKEAVDLEQGVGDAEDEHGG